MGYYKNKNPKARKYISKYKVQAVNWLAVSRATWREWLFGENTCTVNKTWTYHNFVALICLRWFGILAKPKKINRMLLNHYVPLIDKAASCITGGCVKTMFEQQQLAKPERTNIIIFQFVLLSIPFTALICSNFLRMNQQLQVTKRKSR